MMIRQPFFNPDKENIQIEVFSLDDNKFTSPTLDFLRQQKLAPLENIEPYKINPISEEELSQHDITKDIDTEQFSFMATSVSDSIEPSTKMFDFSDNLDQIFEDFDQEVSKILDIPSVINNTIENHNILNTPIDDDETEPELDIINIPINDETELDEIINTSIDDDNETELDILINTSINNDETELELDTLNIPINDDETEAELDILINTPINDDETEAELDILINTPINDEIEPELDIINIPINDETEPELDDIINISINDDETEAELDILINTPINDSETEAELDIINIPINDETEPELDIINIPINDETEPELDIINIPINDDQIEDEISLDELHLSLADTPFQESNNELTDSSVGSSQKDINIDESLTIENSNKTELPIGQIIISNNNDSSLNNTETLLMEENISDTISLEYLQQLNQSIPITSSYLTSLSKEAVQQMMKEIDDLLGFLPDEKIEELARKDFYHTYIKFLDDLGI